MAEGVFENDRLISRSVPRGTFMNRCIKRGAFSRGTLALKQARLEKIPKYSPHCSLCSKGRRIFVLFSNFSTWINTGRKRNDLKQIGY